MTHLKTFKSLCLVALLLATGIYNQATAQTCPVSETVTIIVVDKAVIDAQLDPSSTPIVCVGGSVVINAKGSGGIGDCTITWEISTDDKTFKPFDSKGSPLKLPDLKEGTYYYRAVNNCAESGCGIVYSKSVKITVNPILKIDDLASTLGDITECIVGKDEKGQSLIVKTTGGSTGTLKYQWYISKDGGIKFEAITGATSGTYTPDAGEASTRHYQVKVTDDASGCGTATSRTVIVTVKPDISIITGLTDIAECVEGEDPLKIGVTGGNEPLIYVWEESDSPEGPWNAIVKGTENFFIPPSKEVGVKYYHAVIYSSGTACGSQTSKPAKVEVVGKPIIKLSVPSSTTICDGGTVTLSAKTDGGVNCTIKWQKSIDGFVKSIEEVGKGDTYTTPTLKKADSKTEYRAVFECSGSGCCDK